MALDELPGMSVSTRWWRSGCGVHRAVALLPTLVTIPGAAALLGVTNREVAGLLRGGQLRATRRGRHLHIERGAIDAYRHRN
jgi:excisionase family DNA binding protein